MRAESVVESTSYNNPTVGAKRTDSTTNLFLHVSGTFKATFLSETFTEGF